MVWSDPDTRKATARYLCIHPTTQPLKMLELRGQKIRSPSRAPNLACRAQGRRFDSEEGSLFSHLHSWDNDFFITMCLF